ncbi:MAG: GNAT family N-acetyltransferase [Magnetococcales bacterium]|nr:GNAT family N-acetyltransferase [Magnetococcales bacterium]MBF0149798.1 GNAT family N-acetyltransferase [Magnetococcales bacterium]
MSGFEELIIPPLVKHHDRADFSCGIKELDRYLQRQAGQDIRRRIARVFVCTLPKGNNVLGFYTLSAISIDVRCLPENLSCKLPHHPVPCALIGRLAVDQSAAGNSLGRMMLMDALKRVLTVSSELAIHAMVVDAKNDSAKRFYEKFGFLSLEDVPMRLFLPLGAINL